MSIKRKEQQMKGGNKKQKFNNLRNIEPFWSGIFVTCPRGKEAKCKNEIVDIFDEYSREFYGDLKPEQNSEDSQLSSEEDQTIDNLAGSNDVEESIEDTIARELEELKSNSQGKSTKQGLNKKGKQLFEAMEIGCECVIFVRTRSPIEPVDFVNKICKDIKYGSQIKRSRFAQRITPIVSTATANIDGLNRLFKIILEPEFYNKGSPQAFAIRPTLRNHSTLSREEIIKKTAKFIISAPIFNKTKDNGVGTTTSQTPQENKPKNFVDLKNYEKMVIVECYKSIIGMSVVGPEFEKEYHRFNLEQIFTSIKSSDEPLTTTDNTSNLIQTDDKSNTT